MLRCLFLALLLRSATTFATIQIPDYLVVGNDTLLLLDEPLEALPAVGNSVRQRARGFSTACWRGYVAFWQLSDGRLYLTNVRLCASDSIRYVSLADLFGAKYRDGRVLAEWVNGELFCARREDKLYAHPDMGYFFRSETAYTFQRGKLLSEQAFNNSKTHIATFERTPKVIDEFIYTRLNWQHLPTLRADSAVKVFIAVQTDTAGKVNYRVLKSGGAAFDAEAMRVVRLLREHDWST